MGKFKPHSFETIRSTLSSTLYADMLESHAFKSLSSNAVRLYVYMKLQFYGQKEIKGRDKLDFYFNKAIWKDKYELFKNGEQFAKAKNELITKGFIEEIENGKITRTKTIYRFSEKWKEFKN